MKESEQQVLSQIKPKLKYIISNYINGNEWRKSKLTIEGSDIPIFAVPDLRDIETAYQQLTRFKFDRTACLITIGYERQSGRGNPQPPVQTSENAPNP